MATLAEKILAGAVLAVCAVMLLRLVLSSGRRARFDARLRYLAWSLRHKAYRLWRWPSARREAARAAEEAIRRAREGGQWDGNVYRPKSFKRPKKPH